jgi:hypothetical protein
MDKMYFWGIVVLVLIFVFIYLVRSEIKEIWLAWIKKDRSFPTYIGFLLLVLSAFGLRWSWLLFLQELLTGKKQQMQDPIYEIVISVVLIVAVTFAFVYRKPENNPEHKELAKEPEPVTAKEREKIINELNAQFDKRLEQKLDDRLLLELEFEEFDESGKEIKKDKTSVLESERTIEEEQKTLSDLVEGKKFVLIVGKGGSGKTSCLLNLAKGLLKKAEEDANAPIPVIFNLASWNISYDNFEAWLEKVLVEFYDYPKETAHRTINESEIIPLLDGFDEVGAHLETEEAQNKLRHECLKSITNYKNRRVTPERLVICSRIDEYLKAGGQVSMSLKIQVKEVTQEKVMETLENAEKLSGLHYKGANQAAAKNILALIEKYPNLKLVLQTPFYFNAAIQTFHEHGDEKLPLPDDEGELKAFIVKSFIDRKIDNEKSPYTPKQTNDYLNWLAQWLKEQQNVSFELADFQPHHLKNPRRFGLFFRLLFGFFCFFFSFFIGFFFILFGGLFGGLLGFLFEVSNKINTRDIRIWQWSKLTKPCIIKKITSSQKNILLLTLTLGLGSFFNDFLGDLSLLFFLMSLLGLLFSGFIYISEISYFSVTKSPYERLSAGLLRDATLLGILGICSYFLIIYPLLKDIENHHLLEFTAFYNLLIPMFFGGVFWLLGIVISPISQHFVLAYFLSLENKAPVKMAKFYNHCTDLRLLENEGGRWRFRHQFIHDYFLNQENAQQA